MTDEPQGPKDDLDAEIREVERKLNEDGKAPLGMGAEPNPLDVLEEKAAALLASAAERKTILPEPPDLQQLSGIEQRSQEVRERYEAERAIPESDQKFYKATGLGLSVAYGFLGIPMMFFLIGLGLQKTILPGANTVQIATLVGVGCGFAYLLAAVTRSNKE